MHKKAIIIGVGPIQGLGAQLCLRFAELGLEVFVAGRTISKLSAVVETIHSRGGQAVAVVADATTEADVANLFEQAGAGIDLAIYNTGNNTPGRIAEMDAAYFEKSWRVCCFGGFLFGKEAVKAMSKGGTLLFTGASASLRGRPFFGAFNSSKAALRILAQAMAKEYGEQGIHVGHIVIDGAIAGEKILTNFPDYAEKLGEEGMLSLEGIVAAYEYLYQQPKTAWTFEVDLRPSIEKW